MGFLSLLFLINLIALDFSCARFNVDAVQFLLFLLFFFFSFSLPNFPHRYDISALFNQLPWFFSYESLINPRKTSPTRAITVFFNIFQCFELKRTTFSIFSIERKNRTCKATGSVCVLEGLKYSERQAMENFAIIRFPNKRSLMKRLKDAYPRNVSKRRVYSSTWLPL